ncbi:SsrA-binding protein [Rhodanobacter sp. 115]|nr:SsrA-binding protein [Rhodanobacter sp. 115]
MAKSKDKDNKGGGTIALNKRARHEYHIDQRYEAGIALQGWELKSLRAGRINFGDGYAVVLKGEIFLVGTSIPPLISASTHVIADDRRTRKLLLHKQEIDQLIGAVDAQGLHPGARRHVLERQPGEGGNRPGARQAGARQARHRERTRLATREAAHHALAQPHGLMQLACQTGSGPTVTISIDVSRIHPIYSID